MRNETSATFALLAPAILVLFACGVVPLGFVLFYAVHDTFAGNDFIYVSGQWFWQVLASREFQWALLRSLSFSLLALAVQIPLGLWIALRLPRSGQLSSVLLGFLFGDFGLLAAASVVGFIPGVICIVLVRKHLVRGFSMGRVG
jgi:glycerol transport system permease protein